MIRGIAVAPPDVGSSSRAAVQLVTPAPMPTLSAAAPAPAAVSIDWRAVFGASAVRKVLETWPSARLSSYLRTPAKNAAVGGRPNSYHLVGLAADFVVPRAERARFLAWLRETWPADVDVVDEGDHIHVEWTRVAVTPLAVLLLAGGLVLAGFLLFRR